MKIPGPLAEMLAVPLYGVVMVAKLTVKQQCFVDEYLIDLNATQAAIRAGYSEKNAMRIGYQLRQRPDIQDAVEQAMQKRARRVEITQDWVLEELRRIASSNGADFARVVTLKSTEEGEPPLQTVELEDTDDLPEEKRSAIASIEQTKFGIKVSSYDRVRALELLGKHLGLFDGKGGQTAKAENNLLEAIAGAAGEEVDTDDLPEV